MIECGNSGEKESKWKKVEVEKTRVSCQSSGRTWWNETIPPTNPFFTIF
jgi:hypothetical protein